MPADNTLPQASTARHGDASKPYPCHAWPNPPGAAWAISYGFCRHSLDVLIGKDDARCPAKCKHKAPGSVAISFDKRFGWLGAVKAAEWARGVKG